MMKKIMSAVLIGTAVHLCMPGFALANMKYGEDKAQFLSDLREAASSLEQTNPELSGRLHQYAEKKKEWKEDKHKEMREEKNKNIATLRRASAALQGSNAGLAGELEDMAERWEEKLKHKKEKYDE